MMKVEDKFSEIVRHMRIRAIKMDREGDYWTQEEQDELRQRFDQGTGITEIAILLQRTEPAVIQQIEKMDLYHRKQYPRRRKDPFKALNCFCSTCRVDPYFCPRYKDDLHEEEGI